jgi:hypothetical protein
MVITFSGLGALKSTIIGIEDVESSGCIGVAVPGVSPSDNLVMARFAASPSAESAGNVLSFVVSVSFRLPLQAHEALSVGPMLANDSSNVRCTERNFPSLPIVPSSTETVFPTSSFAQNCGLPFLCEN